jgi:hypothetical protein
MHPLLRLMATRPQLLVDHVQAYADLLAVEIGLASATWKRLALLNAVALVSLGVAATLAGVALMLWSVTPAAAIHAPWALWVAPLLPLALAVGCVFAARFRGGDAAFDILRQQLGADMLVLRQAGGR